MIKRSMIYVAGLTYDLVMLPVICIFISFSFLARKTNTYRKARRFYIDVGNAITKNKKETLLFYCSSVGEFEQALPVMQRFEAVGKNIVVFFHSRNGYDYCASVSHHTAFLAPYDLFFSWFIILRKIKPAMFIINRHEFWPGTILAAAFHSRLFIMNYVVKSSPALMEKFAVHFSEKVFHVNEITAQKDKFFPTGDTRSDRLKERYSSKEKDILSLRITAREKLLPVEKIVLIGNCYNEDLQVLLSAESLLPGNFKFLIVPARNGFDAGLFKKVQQQNSPGAFDWSVNRMIILHTMGNLFELYACADIAWVGGGFTKGIHNCLEADYFNLPVLSGPNLNNQPDALLLEDRKRLLTFKNGSELNTVLLKSISPVSSTKINSLISPADRIYTTLNENNYSR